MGVENDGTVVGVPKILDYEGYTVIHVHVPPSAEVHNYKRAIYDRIDDADVKVTATSQIAAMYIAGIKRSTFCPRHHGIDSLTNTELAN